MTSDESYRCHWGPGEDPNCEAEMWEYMENPEAFNETTSVNDDCECFANSGEDEELCEESYDTGSVDGCYSYMNYDGSYRCHWGPGEDQNCAA